MIWHNLKFNDFDIWHEITDVFHNLMKNLAKRRKNHCPLIYMTLKVLSYIS